MQSKKESWLFSWGYGHEFPNRFIEIEGSYHEAREEMIRRFGLKWAFQYASDRKINLAAANMHEITMEKIERIRMSK